MQEKKDGILEMLNFMLEFMRQKGAEIGEPEEVQVRHILSRHNYPQACYENASRIVLEDREATYVMGYVVVCGCPIDHAWVKTAGWLC